MSLVYLINPSEKRILENAGDRMPLGLISIAQNLKTHGHDVQVWDMNHENEFRLFRHFLNDKPDYVGVSVYTSAVYPEAVDIARAFKGRTKLIAGGYHASAMPDTLTHYFDSVVVGEGELGMLEAMRRNGVIEAKTPDLERLTLETDFVDPARYGICADGRRQGTIITSRGCPYRCAFCFNLTRNVREYPVMDVKERVEQMKQDGFKSIYFMDDVFTLKLDRIQQITEGIELPYRVTTRANLVNKEKVAILAQNGCNWLSLGIESGDDGILKQSNKQMTTAQNEQAVSLANDYGINVKGFFIIGLPGETRQTALKTINFSQRLRNIGLKQADFYYLTPFPGTPIWNDPLSYGINIFNWDYTKYLEAGKTAEPVCETKELRASQIKELVKEAKRQWA